MNTISEIKNDIKLKNFSAVYLLMGEEEFFIDQITEVFIDNVLSKNEKEFNLNIIYGKDASVETIVSICKKYPLMSDYQLVIIKEAQDLGNTIENLTNYLKNPLSSTILVINYKHKSMDKRKSIFKLIQKNGKIFESKFMYDNQVQKWISDRFINNGFTIDQKSVSLINEHLGNKLSNINNEILKLLEIKKESKTITINDIQKYVGISKDFNNFEFRKSIGSLNFKKAHLIADYFSKNPKSNPLVVTITLLFDYFSKLMVYQVNSDLNPKILSSKIGINPYFLNEFASASKNYSIKKIVKVISFIREYDMYSKGVKVKKVSPKLLQELVARIASIH